MNILVLCNRPPVDLASGYDLRVVGLCRELQKSHELTIAIVDLEEGSVSETLLGSSKLFGRPAPAAGNWAKFRLSEWDYFKLLNANEYSSISKEIARIAVEGAADRLLVFGADIAPFVPQNLLARCVVDVCDSPSLIASRRRRLESGARSILGLVEQFRWEALERRLAKSVSAVFAVSRIDVAHLKRVVGRRGGRVHLLENGVPESFDAHFSTERTERVVAFWGNLNFLPNRDSVLDLLRGTAELGGHATDLQLRVIGGNADAEVQEALARAERVQAAGFVKDLPAALSGVPLMVNWMRLGSGMKNKVLEAFRLGIVVVSTEIGVESFEGLKPGEHYIKVDSVEKVWEESARLIEHPAERESIALAAREFSSKYTWSAMGGRLDRVLQSV